MKSIDKNKKGFLLAEETLKIIVAVICILFLVYILIAIYNSQTANKKIEEARDALERVENIVSSLEEGKIERQDIPNPQGWHLYSFVGEQKPNSCLNKNCLCICTDSITQQFKSNARKCDKDGACLVIENLATSDLDLKIRDANNLLFIGIRKQNNQILVGRVS
jgi:competence protein ComGC